MLEFDEQTYHILVVDDEPLILAMVDDALTNAGFQVSTVLSAEEGLRRVKRNGLPHLAVVDINMPYGMDGFEFCEQLQRFSDIPIIMLTAVDEDKMIIQALDNYVEDYVTKPFNPAELVSRVRRVLRRIGDFTYAMDPVTKVDDHLYVDFAGQQISVNGKSISLTPTETKLLYILMRNGGRTVTADFILRRLWPLEAVPDERLRVYIHRLRRKIEAPGTPNYIISQRGIGYSFGQVAILQT